MVLGSGKVVFRNSKVNSPNKYDKSSNNETGDEVKYESINIDENIINEEIN